MFENNDLSKHPQLREFLYKFYPFKLTMFDRYLFKEFIKNTVPALFLFVMVYLLSMLLNEIPYFLRQFDETPQLRFVTVEYILVMYANKAPYFAVWGSPIAFLFGVIYTLSNFYKNNEAVSIIGSGVYIFRFVITILIFSFFYSLALIPFTEYFVVPTWIQQMK